MIQTNFKRYELKYILTVKQYERLLGKMPNDIKLDKYGRHKISNIYFDTDDYRIIRKSLEKPKYKEKLRFRCYGEPNENSNIFFELKKKYNGVVYKRRICEKQDKVIALLNNKVDISEHSQIFREIKYFLKFYDDIKPKAYLSYEREAFYSQQDENFRLTFDFNIFARCENISFYIDGTEKQVLSNDCVLLEVKTVLGLPKWFLEFLNENNIYKTSFSKYGTAYNKYFSQKFINNLGRVSNG